MNRERIEAIWSAILEMMKIAEMVKKPPFLKYRCIEYTFKELQEGRAEIMARLEGDSTYLTMVCGSSTINSGKMFTGEEPGDFLPIDKDAFKQMLEEIFPKGFEEAVRIAAETLNPTPTVNSVVRRIQEMRAKQESASARAGGVKIGIK